MMALKKRVMFYIDGFNLYYGALRDTPYRWLDLEAFCQAYVRSGYEFSGARYFTAKLRAHPSDPGQSERQRCYLRAIGTLPNVSIHYGHFLHRTAVRQLEILPRDARDGDIGLRSVWIHEEKGSDVNLATHLVADGFRHRFDLAVVVSNDSDLKTPISFIRSNFTPVGVLNPHSARERSFALSPRDLPGGSFYRTIKKSTLQTTLLPPALEDAEGTIECPPGWRTNLQSRPKAALHSAHR
jgi:hypothetical protein